MNFYGFDERSSLKLCYTDWQGNRVKKLKRGFATKKEGQAFEREFLQKTTSNLSMTFESFFEIYEKDMKSRLRETTWINKQCIIEQKILPYFKNKKMNEIKPSDIIEWQNRMITYRNENGETYSPTYLKTMHNQISAIFNHATRYYELGSNPARKAGNMGKKEAKEMSFWTKEEYLKFADVIMDKPMSYYAFQMLYWCGIRMGELLALTPNDFNFDNNSFKISKSYENINDYDEDFLETMTLQEIYDTAFEPKKQIIKNFLYSGVYLFVGAPKIGKSFFMAQMGYCVGTGIDLWDYKVKQGKVLYLALEDDYARIQQRMYTMYSTDVDNSDEEKEQGNIKDFHFSTKAKSMADGLIRQLKNFMGRHKGTTLIIIDTLQKVRGVSGDNYSYANDYEVITKIKEFADENNICIIVVHHTRKQLSDDSFEAISGTNGLLGAADGAFMMIKSKRDENLASLEVVGRDIPDQKLNLRKDIKTFLWHLESAQNDLYSKPPDELLEKIAKLVNEDKREWNGTMTELLEELEIEDIKPGAFSRKLNLKLNELFNDYNIEVKRKVTGKARLVSLVLMD